ncbi:EmrB/QacA subfamily drug resistance transporter [Actinocorallia herbida]|uniref:EmrB/QacA subfamily drug resistance transporter n=1 Tax=Actinocorallia herbida TaxID=58109 RepID=A0A3N1CZQ4_9ACTN|nr:MFS transporter [Actinocorallia herbida]ROO86268.1 EmrB/QacA subfamily drug resistance transporter [Actinocorallia herbida]
MGEKETPKGGREGLLVVILALAAAAFALAQTAVLPGIGVLGGELGASATDMSWVMSGYLLSAAVLTPVFGRLGDMYGKRRLLIAALVLFAVSSAVAALAPNVWVLVAARIVQGAGGGIIPLCMGIISDTFSPRRRPMALGIVGATAGIGAGGGLVMGGLLIDHASWPWIFWSGTLMGVAAALGSLLLPGDGARTPGRIDFGGLVLLTVGLVAPLFALTRTSTWGWGDTRTLGLILGGLAVLVVFVLYERRTADPLVDMRVLGRPAVLTTNITMLMFGFGMFGAFMLIPQLAQTPRAVGYGLGLNATGAGLLMLPGCLVMLVAGGLAGAIAMKTGPRVTVTTGAVLASVGLAALALSHGSQAAVIGWSTVLFGGIGLGMAAIPNIIVEACPREMSGQATGVNSLIRSLGSSLGSQIVATLLAGSVTLAGHVPTDAAYGHAFWLGAGGLALAALASLLIPRKSSPTTVLAA